MNAIRKYVKRTRLMSLVLLGLLDSGYALIAQAVGAISSFFRMREGAGLWILLLLGVGWDATPAVAAPFAYVTNFSDGTVSVIDTATNTMVGNPIPAGSFPWGIAITPDGKYVYVANEGSSTVSVIATATNAVVGNPIPIGSYPMGIAITPDGKYAYVTNSGDGTVSVIDTATNTVVGNPIPVGSSPRGVAITPDGKYAYVTNHDSSTVSVIATATNTVVGNPIPVGDPPYGIGPGSFPWEVAITPDGKYAYVAGAEAMARGDVSVIATATNTVIGAPIPTLYAYSVAITPDGKYAYVAGCDSGGDSSIEIIATASNKVVGKLSPEGLHPFGEIAITPDGKYAYVADGVGTVLVIDTASNTIVGDRIPVGGSPIAIAITPITIAPITPFSAFHVSRLVIDQNRGALFLGSNFTLGRNSNGINPVKEEVTLKIANVTLTIPAGSFHQNSHPSFFAFAGQVNNVWIEAFIRPLSRNHFRFQALAYGAPLRDTKNPVTVELTIGDDRGTTTAQARTH